MPGTKPFLEMNFTLCALVVIHHAYSESSCGITISLSVFKQKIRFIKRERIVFQNIETSSITQHFQDPKRSVIRKIGLHFLGKQFQPKLRTPAKVLNCLDLAQWAISRVHTRPRSACDVTRHVTQILLTTHVT